MQAAGGRVGPLPGSDLCARGRQATQLMKDIFHAFLKCIGHVGQEFSLSSEDTQCPFQSAKTLKHSDVLGLDIATGTVVI